MDTDELNRLIRALNRGEEEPRKASGSELELIRPDEAAPALEPSAARPDAPTDGLPSALANLLSETVRHGATDLLLVPGAPPVLRINGLLERVSGGDPLSAQDAFDLLAPSLSADRRRRFLEAGSVDLSLRVSGLGRFRVNLHRTRRGPAAALRVLPKRIPPLAELGLPEMLYDLTKSARGLVLVTGPTGSGKTTTLAALIDRMNRTEKRHIVTIEDPVEYEHAHGRSLVEQVEVGVDAPGFAPALVSALRQNPDVILVGEMRDLETTRAAVTAAQTGHLVLTTLHTNDVPQTINRILDIFPAEQQGQVRQQLSLALSAIVCQQLVPKKSGPGRALALEIAVATDSLRAHVRRGSFHQIHQEMTLGKRFGMVTMEESLSALVQAGTISEADARLRASHPEVLGPDR